MAPCMSSSLQKVPVDTTNPESDIYCFIDTWMYIYRLWFDDLIQEYNI